MRNLSLNTNCKFWCYGDATCHKKLTKLSWEIKQCSVAFINVHTKIANGSCLYRKIDIFNTYCSNSYTSVMAEKAHLQGLPCPLVSLIKRNLFPNVWYLDGLHNAGQGWVSSCKNLFLPNLRFKPVKNGKNQNAGITEWYEIFLFTAAAVQMCLTSIISYHFQQNSYIC